MKKENPILLECIFIAFTIVLTLLVLSPIYLKIGNRYGYYVENTVFIVTFITWTRYIFLLKLHWFAYKLIPKLLIMLVSIPLFFYLLDNHYDFQGFLDNEGIQSIISHLSFKDQKFLGNYINAQMMLFWAGAFIANIMIPFKMISAIWRIKNRGTI